MRGHGAALATIFLLLLIAGVASALPTDPKLGRMSAEGPVSLSSRKAGVALLQGTGIEPGDSVTGLITLTNKGDRTGKLSLMLSGLRDTPGVFGGRLSSVLQLRIDDLSPGTAPAPPPPPVPRPSSPRSRAPRPSRSPPSRGARRGPTRSPPRSRTPASPPAPPS